MCWKILPLLSLLAACQAAPVAPSPSPPRTVEPPTHAHEAPAESGVGAELGVNPSAVARCSEDSGRVRLECHGERILLPRPLVVRPSDLTPNAAARDLLDEVAEFLRDHEDTILLVRIDGFVVSAEAREPERARRLIEQSQSCANVVFQYLWRRRGVSAERMEAVGRGAASDRREPRGACGIELRVAVRR